MNPFDIDAFLTTGGLVGLCLLIFIETGLLIGFVFPGDSILSPRASLRLSQNLSPRSGCCVCWFRWPRSSATSVDS